MANNRIAGGFPFPVFVNETGQRNAIGPGVFVNETVPALGWFTEMARPALRAASLAAVMASGCVLPPVQTSGPEVVTVDKWFQPLQVPVRARPPLVNTQFAFVALQPAAPAAPSFDWYQALREPVRPVPGLSRAAVGTGEAFVALPAVPSIGWLNPLSEPPHRPSLITALQLGSARDLLFPSQEVITLDKWFQGLAEPRRAGPALSRAHVQAGVIEPTLPFDIRGWFQPLAEPTRRPWLQAPYHLVTATSLTFATPEVVTLDKWFEPLSQRLYTRPGLAPYLALVTARGAVAPLPTDVKLSMWFKPLAEPVRAKPVTRTASMQFWAGSVRFLPGPENVTMDKWFEALNRPVPGLPPRAFGYQYAVIGMVPVVPATRHGGLSGSVDGSVNLAGDSSVSRVTLGGSTGAVRLSGRVTNS